MHFHSSQVEISHQLKNEHRKKLVLNRRPVRARQHTDPNKPRIRIPRHPTLPRSPYLSAARRLDGGLMVAKLHVLKPRRAGRNVLHGVSAPNVVVILTVKINSPQLRRIWGHGDSWLSQTYGCRCSSKKGGRNEATQWAGGEERRGTKLDSSTQPAFVWKNGSNLSRDEILRFNNCLRRRDPQPQHTTALSFLKLNAYHSQRRDIFQSHAESF